MDRFETLKAKLPEILGLVEGCPKDLQPIVCQSLIEELRSSGEHTIVPPANRAAKEQEASSVTLNKVDERELPGIAMFDEDGKFRITIREIPGKKKTERARHLVYIAIRAHELMRGDEGLSSRLAVTPILREWRLYDGNTRTMMSRDKGIRRSGDILKLDTPAKIEADKFIDEVLRPNS